MTTTLAAFRKHLADGPLKPVYLLAGSEHLLLIEAADALRARARALGYSEREVIDADAKFDWDELSRAAVGMSLFATHKLIDLRLPTGKPGKDGSAALIHYCTAPPPDTVLMITAHDWSRAHETAWVKTLLTVGIHVPIWPLKREEMPAWIGARLASRGLRATPDAMVLLADRVEGNLLAAAQEIDKLGMTAGSDVIDAEAMESRVADDARYDVFRLTDAALAGDAARALHIVAGLRAEGEEVMGLLGWVLNQLRLLLRLAEAGRGIDAVFRAERVWPQRQSLYKQALKHGGTAHWEQCLVQAGKVDRIAKGRADGDAWVEFERLVAAIAAPRRARDLIR